jgi:hypothetical protein
VIRNYTDLKKKIDKYCDLSYDDVNYGGPLGLLSTFYHKVLEKFTNSDKNYEKVLEAGGGGQHLKHIRHSFSQYVITDLNVGFNGD